MDVRPDGTLAYNNLWAKMPTTWWVDGDHFFHKSTVVLNNRAFHGHFYRNQTPTDENPHPFIYVNIWDRYYFSTEKLTSDGGG